MTEYSVEKFYNEYAIKQEDTIVAVIDSGTNARKVCDLLNEQEEVITNLRLSIEVTGKAYRKSVKDYEEFIEELEKENKELKKELESFEQVNFTDLCDKSRTVLYMKKENVDDLND